MAMSELEVGEATETWFTMEADADGTRHATLWDHDIGGDCIRCVCLTNMDESLVEIHSDPEIVAMYLDA